MVIYCVANEELTICGAHKCVVSVLKMKNSDPLTYASVIRDVRNNAITIDDETLERMKAKFSHVINSTRSMFYVRTLKELVNLLELRAIDGRDRDEFSVSLVECADSSKKAEKSVTCEKPRKAQGIPRHVLDMISDKIGRKWWDLAHYLDIPDNDIEEIEGKYPFSMKRQAYQALLTFCNQPGIEGKESKLLDALEKARRYDLKSQVEAVLSNENSQRKK